MSRLQWPSGNLPHLRRRDEGLHEVRGQCPLPASMAKERDWRSYDENLALGRRYTIDWDDPALKMPASESSPFK